MSCRFCASGLREIFFLADSPLSGVFPADRSQPIQSGPLTLCACEKCGLVQLLETYDLDSMYGDNYGYRSGLNPSMVRHLQSNIRNLESLVSLDNGDLVIDIASNDSTSLQQYSNESLVRHGIDPTASKFSKYYPPSITYTADFFSLNTAKRVKSELSQQAKAISSFSVLYDLPSPADFVRGIECILHSEGIWMSEQSYLPFMLEKLSFDTICHEHLEYYTLTSVSNILSDSGLILLDVDFNDVNGGSFIFYAAHASSSYQPNTEKLNSIFETEKKTSSLDALYNFAENCSLLKSKTNEWFKTQLTAGKSIAALGASTKGNIALHYFQLSSQQISVIGEVNEEKIGKLTPGTHIPIVSEEECLNSDYDYYIVLPWHFKKHFLSNPKYAQKQLVFLHPTLEFSQPT